MRSYEEISNRIMERGDKLIESRKVRAAKIRHTSYAVSGMCAAAIAGIGVWHIASNMKKPDDGFNGSGIISATETVTENTTAADNTTKAGATETTTAKKTTAVTTDKKATETTAAEPVSTTAVTTDKIPVRVTSATESTVRPNPSVTTTGVNESGVVTTSGNTSVEITPVTTKAPTGEEIAERTTTIDINEGAVTTKPDGAVTTTIPMSSMEDGGTTTKPYHGEMEGGNGGATAPTTTTTSVQDAFRTYPTYITLHDVRYDKEGIVAADSIGSRISRVDVNIQYLRQTIRDVMNAYRIVGIDEEEAVAVRLKDTDEYYLFRNASYKKEE